jgi:hypothetical protein
VAAGGENGGMPEVQRPAMSDHGVPVEPAGAPTHEHCPSTADSGGELRSGRGPHR